MPESEQELEELKRRVAELTQRVYRLEQAGGVSTAAAPVRTTEARPEPPPSAPPPVSAARPPAPVAAPRAAFADANLETKIGSQWLNRIGIFALLIAAAYFLKLAFDNGWIGPSGRVAIGLLSGMTLIFFANRIHGRGMKYFAYSLAAVGIGVMYLSLWAAFQLYQLVPGGIAFVAMVVVTASAATLALRLDAQILAVVALAGGFATPALLSTGQNRPIELFTYLFVLDLAAVVLVTMRPWRRLLAGCFWATIVYYFGWHFSFFRSPQTAIAVTYAAAFFVLFATLPIIRQLHSWNGKDIGWGASKTFVSVALLNPVVFFLELFSIYEAQTGYRNTLAWCAVGLGAFYIVIARMTSKHAEVEGPASPVIRWLHLAIALGFLTIAIPLKLEGHWITMAWFVESAVLLFIGARLDHAFLKSAAIAALALGVIRLLFIDDFHPQQLIFNARMATYALAVAILVAITTQLRKERGDTDHAYIVASVALNALALVAILGEASHYYQRVFASGHFNYSTPQTYENWRDIVRQRDFIYSGLTMVYGFGLLAVGVWRRSAVLRWQALILIFCTIAKVFLYDLSNLTGVLRVLSFLALGLLLMAASFIYQRDWLKLSAKEQA